jgi:hypothetical protein
MLSATYNSDMPAAVKEFERLQKEARRRAVAEVTNRVLRVTLPFSVSNLPKNAPPSKGLNAKPINALKKRIKKDILGDNKIGSGLMTATRSGDGGFVWESFKGRSSMPFVILPGQRGRKRKNPRPPRGLVTSGPELVRKLKETTQLVERKKVAHRILRPGAKYFWTTLKAARAAAAILQKNAGYLFSGWHALARVSKNAKFSQISVRARANGKGRAGIRVEDGLTALDAENLSVSNNKRVQSYQQRVVNSHIEGAFDRAMNNAEFYAEKAFNKWLKNNIK